jgi:hypothetical protein
MAQRSRVNLKAFFLTGFKPTESNFADLIDSSLNKEDEGIIVDGQDIQFSAGVTVGNSSNTEAGTIRWTGTQFEGFDGTAWGSLGGGSSPWVSAGGDDVRLNNPAGRVSIGTAAAPQFFLDVAPNTDSLVRFGQAVVGGEGGRAKFCHTGQQAANNYALRQDASGAVFLNTPSAALSLILSEAGTGRVFLFQSRLGIGAVPANPLFLLAVNGDAAKVGGGPWGALSDERLKKEVKPYKDGLEKLLKLNPVSYKYNGLGGMPDNGKTYIGLIAQEVKESCPYMVGKYSGKLKESDKKNTDLLSFDGNAISYMLVNAMKEMEERVRKLEKKN